MRLHELLKAGPVRNARSVLHGRLHRRRCGPTATESFREFAGATLLPRGRSLAPGLVYCLILVLGLVALRAAEPGEQVVVVYNSRVPESKVVADYYAVMRKVPP